MGIIKRFKFFNYPVINYLALTLLFFALVILLPASKPAMQQYHLSNRQYHVLLFVVELPLSAIWFAAFYGYAKLKQYAASIHQTPEEQGFVRLATGCAWLAWGLVIPSLVSLLASASLSSHSHLPSLIIIFQQYLSLLFPIIAFSFMAEGTHHLFRQQRLQLGIFGLRSLLLLFAALTASYCYLAFRYVHLGQAGSTDNPYHLAAWLVTLTIVIPYLYAWFIGLYAAYELSLLATHVKGLLYRRALQLVAGGMTLVIASSICIQCLRSTIPRPGHLSLNSTLVIIYLIYIVTVLGFVLISLGAKRLKKIEDI